MRGVVLANILAINHLPSDSVSVVDVETFCHITDSHKTALENL